MASEVWTAVIGGVSGLVSGAIASLVAPWANWSIEKRREDRRRRYDLLDSWRTGIASMPVEASHDEYIRRDWYETLRPHLGKDVLGWLEKPRTLIVRPETGRGLKDLFTGEVDRIESEWGLRP
jgi:hypothetical protein